MVEIQWFRNHTSEYCGIFYLLSRYQGARSSVSQNFVLRVKLGVKENFMESPSISPNILCETVLKSYRAFFYFHKIPSPNLSSRDDMRSWEIRQQFIMDQRKNPAGLSVWLVLILFWFGEPRHSKKERVKRNTN